MYKINNKWISIGLSSLFFSLAFYFPHSLGWLTFFYFVPIFYYAFDQKLSFKDGYIWGILTYGVHFYYMFPLISEKANGKFKLLVPIFIILYFSLYSAFWFMLTGIFKSKKLSLLLSTFLYTYAVYSWSFIIFLVPTGYVFTHPLLPICANGFWLKIMPIIGIWPLTLCLISFSIIFCTILKDISQRKIIKPLNVILTLLFFMPFLYGFFTPKFRENNKTEKIVSTIGFIIPPKVVNKTPYELAFEIKLKIIELLTNSPGTKIICMPESTFPFELNKFKEVISWWFCDFLDKDYQILIGAHRSDEKGNLYNCVYQIKNGQIINYYDKKDRMFFVEFLPAVWKDLPFIKSLFLDGQKELCSGTQLCTFNIEGRPANICICSELFLNNIFDPKEDYIFFFLNESWFSCQYIKQLLFLYIDFKMIQLGKKIICASYTRSNFFN